MSEGVIGVNVVVSVGGTDVYGQRGAKLSMPMDMIDMTVKADFPWKKFQPGWIGPAVIECDCILCSSGTSGFAALLNAALARELVAVSITIGDTGEELSGNAYIMPPEFDAPQDKEGTMSVKLQVDGELVAESGS
jgi:predicted secreted protein